MSGLARCPEPDCGGTLLSEPEDPAINYRGRADRRVHRWVRVCLWCGRSVEDEGQELGKVAERRLR